MTQFPTWLAGQRVTASGLLLMESQFAVKPAFTSRATTTTMSADPDLVLDVAATSATYAVELFLLITGAAVSTGDLKMMLNYTGSSSFSQYGYSAISATSVSTVVQGGNVWGATSTAGTNGGTFQSVMVKGSLFATTAGQIQLQWAQNTSSATGTIIRQGSWMRVTRIA